MLRAKFWDSLYESSARRLPTIKFIEEIVLLTGDELYWSASSDKTVPTTEPSDYFGFWYYRPPAADVEMTGYALMSYLKHKQSMLDATKIIKWLSKQRNNYGGFSTTQVCENLFQRALTVVKH